MFKVLVTGGAGFIGSHLVDALIKKGHRVIVVDNLLAGKKENINPRAKFYKIDVGSNKLNSVFKREKPDFIFHLAAQINVRYSIEDPIFDAQSNIIGGLNILENCRKYGVKKIIFSSTGGAMYGPGPKIIPTPESHPALPIAPYGISKLTTEKYLDFYFKVFGIPYIALRLANVYGPRQDTRGEAGVIAIFADKLLKNQMPRINGNGRQTRDYIYVGDVSDAFLLALKSKKNGVYNIGTARETSVNEVYKRITEATAKKIKAKHGPAIKGEARRSALNSGQAKKDLGWRPKVNLKEGIKKTVNWLGAH
jgi:UDP-glucose 4-epimerase